MAGRELAVLLAMTRPLCFIRRNELLDLTMRTEQGRALLRPTRALTLCILGVLARCLALYKVELHAFVFLSNHGHLLASVENAFHATSFVRDFKRDTSKAIKRLTGWDSQVWAPSRPIPILDHGAAIDRLAYVFSNGVKEGLVDHPLAWPGANSTRALLGDMTIVVPGGRRDPTSQTIRLAPLPALASRTCGEQRAVMHRLIEEVVIASAVARAGKPSLGLRGILDVDPFAPIPLAATRAPIAHASSAAAVADYKEERDAHGAAYRAASGKLRAEGSPISFPSDSFLPSPGYED